MPPERATAPGSRRRTLLLFAALVLLACCAVAFCWSQGYILYWGDALSHLTIARRMVDSRTPGWDQIGTVWLPLPHVLMLPLVRYDAFWRSGLAGSIPSAACYVLAALFLFFAVRRAFANAAAGAAACFALALNPNVLYLASIPMTETVFLACLAGLLYFTVLFRDKQSLWAVVPAGFFALAGTLTRYEGWFLIPFVCGYLLIAAKRRRFAAALLFGLIASLGPLYWLAHNWWYYGNALEFYNGPYSAKAYYQHALDAHMARYPGDHDWLKAWLYFRTAVRLVAGAPLVWIGLAGITAALLKRRWWPAVFLALAPAFYIWSIHSAATPIFVPELWPNTWYNARYAIPALPLLAFGAAGLVALLPWRFRQYTAALVVAAAAAPWLAYPRRDSWICWKESQVNSEGRRAWTREAAGFLGNRYGTRDGVFTLLGDLAGIYREAGIPLRETLHDGNQPEWAAATARPDLFLHEQWAVAISGDAVATALERAQKSSPRYDLVKTITVKGAPAILIFRRAADEHPIHEGARREE